MRKILTSLVLGALLSMPATALAGCSRVLKIGTGDAAEVLFLTAEYTVNGVLFCEYN